MPEYAIGSNITCRNCASVHTGLLDLSDYKKDKISALEIYHAGKSIGIYEIDRVIKAIKGKEFNSDFHFFISGMKQTLSVDFLYLPIDVSLTSSIEKSESSQVGAVQSPLRMSSNSTDPVDVHNQQGSKSEIPNPPTIATQVVKILVARDGNTLGEFEIDKIKDAIKLGVLKSTDHYYDGGTKKWDTLDKFIASKNKSDIYKGCGGCLIIFLILGLLGSIFDSSDDNSGTNDSSTLDKPREEREIVSNSSWDGSVSQVKDYLKVTLKDPKSLEFIEWSKVIKNDDGDFNVRVKFRAKNSFGGYVLETWWFYLSPSGAIKNHIKL